MNKFFESYAVGQIISIQKTVNDTFILIGSEQNYRCELVKGNQVYIY